MFCLCLFSTTFSFFCYGVFIWLQRYKIFVTFLQFSVPAGKASCPQSNPKKRGFPSSDYAWYSSSASSSSSCSSSISSCRSSISSCSSSYLSEHISHLSCRRSNSSMRLSNECILSKCASSRPLSRGQPHGSREAPFLSDPSSHSHNANAPNRFQKDMTLPLFRVREYDATTVHIFRQLASVAYISAFPLFSILCCYN